MDSFERKTQQQFGELLARQSELDNAISALEMVLQENDTFKSLQKLKEEREHLYDDFKAKCEEQFAKRKIKTVSGEFGKVTMVSRTSYRVSDPDKVPEKYYTRMVDLHQVKKDAELFKKEIPGIEQRVSGYIKLSPANDGESS